MSAHQHAPLSAILAYCANPHSTTYRDGDEVQTVSVAEMATGDIEIEHIMDDESVVMLLPRELAEGLAHRLLMLVREN